MASKKEFLQHRVYGKVQITDAYTTSEGSDYFKAEGRMLLSEPQYWLSEASEISRMFEVYSKRHLAKLVKKRSAEHRTDAEAAARASGELNKVTQTMRHDEAEISELEMENHEGSNLKSQNVRDDSDAGFAGTLDDVSADTADVF